VLLREMLSVIILYLTLAHIRFAFYELASHPVCNAGSPCCYQRSHSGWLRGGSHRLMG